MTPPATRIGQQVDALLKAAAESMLGVLADHGADKGLRLELAIAHVGEIAAGRPSSGHAGEIRSERE